MGERKIIITDNIDKQNNKTKKSRNRTKAVARASAKETKPASAVDNEQITVNGTDNEQITVNDTDNDHITVDAAAEKEVAAVDAVSCVKSKTDKGVNKKKAKPAEHKKNVRSVEGKKNTQSVEVSGETGKIAAEKAGGNADTSATNTSVASAYVTDISATNVAVADTAVTDISATNIAVASASVTNATVTDTAVTNASVSDASAVITYKAEPVQNDKAVSAATKNHSDDLDEDDDYDDEENVPYNRRNVNRIKKAILITALLLIVIPMCLSIFLFFRVNKLEKELKACRDELSEKSTETETIDDNKEKLSEEGERDDIEYQISMYADAKNNLLQSSEDFEFITVDESSNTEESVLIDDNSSNDADEVSQNDNSDAASDAQESAKDDSTEAKDEAEEDSSEDDADAASDEDTEDDTEEVPLNGKKVYLTFDDGPSGYTDEILDILKEKGVKATFFVVAKEQEYYPDYVRIVEDGHSIGIHSYSHIYDTVYKNLNYFKSDVESMHDLIYNVTGYDAWLYRFPGGSSNKVSGVDIQECMKYLDDNGYVYFDWNAQNGDAVDYYVSPDQLNANVMSFVRNNSSDTVVLMHDLGSHHNTVEALPDLIDTLKAEGYEILPITKDTTPVRHVKYEGDEK